MQALGALRLMVSELSTGKYRLAHPGLPETRASVTALRLPNKSFACSHHVLYPSINSECRVMRPWPARADLFVSVTIQVIREQKTREKEAKEAELRELAMRARQERVGGAAVPLAARAADPYGVGGSQVRSEGLGSGCVFRVIRVRVEALTDPYAVGGS